MYTRTPSASESSAAFWPWCRFGIDGSPLAGKALPEHTDRLRAAQAIFDPARGPMEAAISATLAGGRALEAVREPGAGPRARSGRLIAALVGSTADRLPLPAARGAFRAPPRAATARVPRRPRRPAAADTVRRTCRRDATRLTVRVIRSKCSASMSVPPYTTSTPPYILERTGGVSSVSVTKRTRYLGLYGMRGTPSAFRFPSPHSGQPALPGDRLPERGSLGTHSPNGAPASRGRGWSCGEVWADADAVAIRALHAMFNRVSSSAILSVRPARV